MNVGIDDAGDHRVEVAQQLLEAQEVPGGLRRVRRQVGVGELSQRRVEERREHDQRRQQDEHGHELFDQQVRPDVDAVALLALDPLDALGRDQGEQAVLVVGALLRRRDVAGRQRRRPDRRGDGGAAVAARPRRPRRQPRQRARLRERAATVAAGAAAAAEPRGPRGLRPPRDCAAL